MVLHALNTPAQHPVITLVGDDGNVLDVAQNPAGVLINSYIINTAPTAWPGVNMAIFNRVYVPLTASYRYFLVKEGVQSGNIQAGLVRLSGANRLTFTRVMNTGVIAAPVAGDLQLDCGTTEVENGDYAFFVWADNTTVTLPHVATATVSASRISAAQTIVGGVPASGTISAWGSSRLLGPVGVELNV